MRPVEEALRDMWTFPSLESWWRDIRYAIRSLAAAPGFAAVAIIALALGIGANTAIFTIVQGAFSWNLGLDHLDRIMLITTTNSAEHRFDWTASYPDFRDIRARSKTLDGIAAYRFVPANVSDSKTLPERLWCVQMSSNGFDVAEYKPALGRGFLEADELPNAPPVVVLGHHIWQSRYGGDENILNKTIRVDEVPRTVIGIMPKDRRFPEDTDIWTPLAATEKRDDRTLMMFARLPEKANISTVLAELDTIGRSLAAEYPGTNKDLSAGLRPIAEITGLYGMRPVFAVLFAAVGFVLLIACADVANMLLARGSGRTREMAIRLAIGAGKARILRQLLLESVVISAAGGILGWVVALGGLKWFDLGVTTLDKPVWLHLSLDRWAFFYMAAISVGAGVVSGFAPAWRLLARTGASSVLKDGGHGSVSGRATSRLASGLVVFQMVLCVVLLAGAGLLIRSARQLSNAPVGVTTSNILTARINLPHAKYPRPADRIEFHRAAQTRIESLPGVAAEAIASNPPVGGSADFDVQLQTETATRRLVGIVVTPPYFAIFDLKPVSGRLFTTGDSAEAVVNQSFAAKYWPNEEAVGKRLRLVKDRAPQQWLTVTGVIPDVPESFRTLLEHRPLIYLPYAQAPDAQTYILVRTRVPPATLANPLRAEIQKMDPNLPLFRTVTLESRMDSAVMEVAIIGDICSVFAGIALILATVGLYSVIAHSVNMRSQEIGLRIAMGGTERDILKLVFIQGMRPLLIGLSIGIPLALAAMSVLRGTLAGVTPTDPLTFASVIIVLLAAGMLGCVIPARRATRVDPVVALRCQ